MTRREIMRVDVLYEDSAVVLVCSSWSNGDVTFKLSEVSLDKICNLCNVSFSPGSSLSDIATLVHAMTAVAGIMQFPMKDDCLRVIAMLRSQNTTRLLFAPPGLVLHDMCEAVTHAAAQPIVPLLACTMTVTEFLSPTWTLSVTLTLTESRRHQTVVVIISQRKTQVMRVEFKTTDSGWYNPTSLTFTNNRRPTHNKAVSFLLKNDHVRDFPFGQPLKRIGLYILDYMIM